MSRPSRTVVEYRDYALPANFPVVVLTGEVWRISDKPSGVYHFHNCLEIGLCESDGATLEFPDAKFHVSAGDVTLISSDLPHTTYSDPGCASKWSYFYTEPDDLLRPFPKLNLHIREGMLRSTFTNYRNIVRKEDDHTIRLLVQGLVHEVDEQRPNYEVTVRGLFLALIAKVVSMPSTMSPDSSVSAMAISPALSYIETNYAQKIEISTLSTLCHMSQSHFRRVFSEIMNCSPLEHLNHIRINRACSLLRISQESMTGVAEKTGFTSISSFNRHFHEETGMTPTEWRRQANADQEFTIQHYSGWLVPPKEE